MDKERILSEINYYLSTISESESNEAKQTILKNVDAFLEGVLGEENLILDEDVNKKLMHFISMLKKNEMVAIKELKKNDGKTLKKVLELMQTFLHFFEEFKNANVDILTEIDTFILDNHMYLPFFNNFYFALQERIYDAFIDEGNALLKKALDNNSLLSSSILIFYIMQKRKLYDIPNAYLSFYTPIPNTFFIEDIKEHALLEYHFATGEDNSVFLSNLYWLYKMHYYLLDKGGLKKKYKDARYDLGLKKMAFLIDDSFKGEMFRYDYLLKKYALEELMHDLKGLNLEKQTCFEVIINTLENNEMSSFYKEKMGIRTVNAFKELLDKLSKITIEDKKVNQVLYRLVNSISDKGDFKLSQKEVRKAILVLLIEYVHGEVYGKAHQNLLADCLSLEKEALLEKYREKSNVLRELISKVSTEYTKISILLEIQALHKNDNLKKVLEDLIDEDMKLYNLVDLDIFEEIVNKSYGYYLKNKESYLFKCPLLYHLASFNQEVSVEKLDFILEVLNQENFLNSYEKEISKENFSLYPNISDAFKQYRVLVGSICSDYLRKD